MNMKMNPNRRMWWLGGIVVVAGAALAAGVPLATLLYLGAILACPAAMFFGMGMMGRMQGAPGLERASASADALPQTVRSPVAVPEPPQREMLDSRGAEAVVDPDADDDPVMILKRRLARGAITVEEYERLMAVVAAPIPAAREP